LIRGSGDSVDAGCVADPSKPGIEEGAVVNADDRLDELRSLAADLEADAAEFEPATEHEAGVVEGLGRAVGRVKARAAEPDDSTAG
jgi:hypothetical protein